MVTFWPMQQELDCISNEGHILGKIKFDGSKNQYAFFPADGAPALSSKEEHHIIQRLAGLAAGKYTIPMQDDD